jgi:hypothetical protein
LSARGNLRQPGHRLNIGWVKIGFGDAAQHRCAVDDSVRIAYQALKLLEIFECAVNPLNRDFLEAGPPRGRAAERAYAPTCVYEFPSYCATDESGRSG